MLAERLKRSCGWETDGSRTYVGCVKDLESATHIVTKSGTAEAHETFEWIDKIIRLTKAFIQGTSARMEFLQSYLEEFAYRFNQRHYGNRLVERLPFACAS